MKCGYIYFQAQYIAKLDRADITDKVVQSGLSVYQDVKHLSE